MTKSSPKYISLILWVLSLVFIGFVLGSLTKVEVNTWYETLNRSSLSPPDFIFPIVWTLLYAMIGVCGWLIWSTKIPESSLLKILFTIQLLLNWSWTPLFFTNHLIGTALISISLLTLFTLSIIIKAYKNLKWVSILFTPYFFWLLFATYLNFYIWQYN